MSEQEKKLIEAAKLIKEHCRKKMNSGGCRGCVFKNERVRGCPLMASPDYWKIPESKGESA